MEYLAKIEGELDQFLLDNFSSVLDNAFDSFKYYSRIIKTIGEFKGEHRGSGSDVVGSIFRKLKAIIEPLAPSPAPRDK